MKTTSTLIVRLTAMFILISAAGLFAQETIHTALDVSKRAQLKSEGRLNGSLPLINRNSGTAPMHITNPSPQTNSVLCDCWIPVDGTWNVVPFDFGVAPEYRNDDYSTLAINLPFNFCFYGTPVNQVFINNNGNVSIGTSYGTFSSVSFPTNQFVMIAPFWADVDTRNTGSGIVYYKITPTYMIVQWDTVGYFTNYIDKLNSFQLIITDGIDPILPSGNVSFCYHDMQWTTGDASLGTNGFGGTPATVGINQGNGVDFIQIGMFDQPGTTYDGPYGANDGVSYLDNQSLFFDACFSGSNEPPLVSSQGICDTITLCEGDTILLTVNFYSPEVGQITTDSVNANGMTGVSVISNTSGNISTTVIQLIGLPSNMGYNTILVTGTDNGVPNASTTISIHINVVPAPNAGFTYLPASPVPVGTNVMFTNTTTPAGMFFLWNFGDGSATTVTGNPNHIYNTPGTYTITLTATNPAGCTNVYTMQIVVGGCALTSAISATSACVGGVVIVNYAGNASTGASYTWNFGSAIVISGSGQGPYQITYNNSGTASITVYIDDAGCLDTAITTLTVFPEPAAPSIVQGGDTLYATTGYVSYQWYYGSNVLTGATNANYVATQSGNYNLVVTDANGCQVGTGILNVIASADYFSTYSKEIKVFPNPASNSFTLTFPSASVSAASLAIINTLGQSVFSRDFRTYKGENKVVLNAQMFAKGIYLVKILLGDLTMTREFVISY